MLTVEQLFETYKEIALEVPHHPTSTILRYVAIEDIRRKLKVKTKTIVTAILQLNKYRLAKAPAALRERRYEIKGEEWTFIQIEQA